MHILDGASASSAASASTHSAAVIDVSMCAAVASSTPPDDDDDQHQQHQTSNDKQGKQQKRIDSDSSSSSKSSSGGKSAAALSSWLGSTLSGATSNTSSPSTIATSKRTTTAPPASIPKTAGDGDNNNGINKNDNLTSGNGYTYDNNNNSQGLGLGLNLHSNGRSSSAYTASAIRSDSSNSRGTNTAAPREESPRPSLSSSRRPPSSNTLSALLEPFDTDTPHNKDTEGRIRIPASSRAGADIATQKTANSIGIFESWKYLPFLAHQASKLASAFVSHHVFGPPKKSWGIELTLFTTAVRESVQFSHLSSLDTLRKFLNLGQILPVPKDGVVTPVTFTVQRRDLPGVLAEADAVEDGTREISGEWVVSRRIWRRMQREHYGPTPLQRTSSSGGKMGNGASSSSYNKSNTSSKRRRSSGSEQQKHHSSNSSSLPHSASSQHSQFHPHIGKDKVILYLHGGAYYVMSAATHRYITISVSKYTNCRVFAVNYRLAPECRWPGQIHDAVSAYLRLVNDLKIPPENIIFAGDSAGGGLTLATLMYLRDHGFSLPCGAIIMSPWVDLTMSCDSWETNAPYDYLRMPSGDDHMNPIASLLGASNVKRLITHPYVSPLFGDFTGFPPLLIQCGDAECLRDEGTLLAHKASLAGVQVYHEVYEDCPHVFQALFFLEASKKAFRSHRNFVKRVLPSARHSTRVDLSSMDQEVMSDAHAIKADGQPELESLPASPQMSMRRSLSSVDNAARDEAELGEADFNERERIADREADYDDEEDEEEDANPFNVDSSEASATASDRTSIADENEYEPVSPLEMPDNLDEARSNLALRATANMVKTGAAISGLSHHDLDSVAEEQDDHIASMEYQENNDHSRPSTSASSSSGRLNQFAFPGSSHSSQRTSVPHSRNYESRSTITPSASPASSYIALPYMHSQPSSTGTHTPAHNRTPTSSAPSSPGTFRQGHRQRSLSTLSMAALTPATAQPPPSSGYQAPRPGHSRSSSSASVATMRPGIFKEQSRPRARATSHPDLQALLDSYESSGGAQQTVVWRSEVDDSSAEGNAGQSRSYDSVSDAEGGSSSMDDDEF